MAKYRRSPQLRLPLQLYIFLGLLVAVFASLPEERQGETAVGESRMEALGRTPGQRVLAAVPASGRVSFLLYQLASAINSAADGLLPQTVQEQVEVEMVEDQQQFLAANPDPNWLAAMANEFQNVPVYETFPADLQHWLMDSYGLSATDVFHSWAGLGFGGRSSSRTSAGQRRSQVICTTDGQCYEVDKIVTACCPF